MFGVNGLVARFVVGAGFAADIGRQRQAAVFFEQLVNVQAAGKADLEQLLGALLHHGFDAAVKQ